MVLLWFGHRIRPDWTVYFPSPLQDGAVQLHGTGDEAAVDVLKILRTNASLIAAEQQTVLDIIHTAFEQPALIINPAHQMPLAARFSLQRLASTTDDPLIKQRVTKEVTFLGAAVPPAAKLSVRIGELLN